MKPLMLYTGAAIVILWGIAHIVIPTRSIIDAFGPISADNQRTLLMEWLMEGVLLVFIGVLVVLVASVAPEPDVTAVVVYRVSASALVVMAGISLFTGARTAVLPMKLCPVIFLMAAV
ncbi:MAG: hypothetical protein OEM99_16700, partial [Gammaproteobacteria bacterium]|nr:hypothetical protein [Gammaproteobacteria bacterium]